MESTASPVGRVDLTRQPVALMQRQAELVQELLERERRHQRQLLGPGFAPLDAPFDLVGASASSLRAQAEAVEHAAQAMEQAASQMKTQGGLLERAVRMLREPPRRIESALGVDCGRR